MARDRTKTYPLPRWEFGSDSNQSHFTDYLEAYGYRYRVEGSVVELTDAVNQDIEDAAEEWGGWRQNGPAAERSPSRR